MATLAGQAYLIASFNLLLASRRKGEELSSSAIVALLCRMMEGEDIRAFQKESPFPLCETGAYGPYRL
ncbi:MAG: hypothetical protein WBO46_08585 [Caldilineaceae bacterium]